MPLFACRFFDLYCEMALNALLFVFWHGLNKPDVHVDDSVRARPRADDDDLYARGIKNIPGVKSPLDT